MSVNALINLWRSQPSVWGNVAASRVLKARQAQTTPLPEEMHPDLRGAFERRGFQALYSHQATSWKHVQGGENIVVVTGTASGKTLCFNLPVLDRLLRDPQARALYLYPTRALSQDQHDELNQWNQALPGAEAIPVGTYTGDTPQSARPKVRKRARVLLSTPDMLHLGILPHHTRWVEFLSNLRFVAIDEMHTYRGLFGSHVANVMRRLKRIARFYGASPQFIMTSATIANPIELAGNLIEEPVKLVDDDGSPRGPKHFLIYNPPVVDQELGIRQSALRESVRLAGDLLTYDVQSVLFCPTRRAVELTLNHLRQESELEKSKIRGYRSGYLARQRREIEDGLRNGEVRAVAATTALEMGVDIGGMGAAVLEGYPGTIASTWQQAGRAGRSEEPSLAALVASANPLDQFLAQHPDYFFGRSPEQALINPDNELILLGHIRCAAYELPFHQGEPFGKVEGQRVGEYLKLLAEEAELRHTGEKYFWVGEGYPAQAINVRGSTPDQIVLQAEQDGEVKIVGQIDTDGAHRMVHPEAIYLHEGETYIVEELNLEEGVARLRPTDADYYTIPRSDSELLYLEATESVATKGAAKSYGKLATTQQVVGYHKVQWFTNQRVGVGQVDLPARELHSTGYWMALDEAVVESLRQAGQWGNDPNDYGPDWKSQKEQARQRDDYRCQVCGAPEEGHAHHVHHRIPFRNFRSPREANRLENLITLCPTCHRHAETVVRVRSGLSGLAFTLRHLAPLFLMCDSRDLEVHSDPQAKLLEDHPIIVIYDNVPGGIGFSVRLFELHEELVGRAYELVSDCACNDGCPSCVGPGGEQGSGSKSETLAILKALRQ